MWHGFHGWMFGGMWFFPLIFIIICIVILFMIFGKKGTNFTCHDTSNHGNKETALDILKKRYAKGEITKEEFEEMKKDI